MQQESGRGDDCNRIWTVMWYFISQFNTSSTVPLSLQFAPVSKAVFVFNRLSYIPETARPGIRRYAGGECFIGKEAFSLTQQAVKQPKQAVCTKHNTLVSVESVLKISVKRYPVFFAIDYQSCSDFRDLPKPRSSHGRGAPYPGRDSASWVENNFQCCGGRINPYGRVDVLLGYNPPCTTRSDVGFMCADVKQLQTFGDNSVKLLLIGGLSIPPVDLRSASDPEPKALV
ncbi:hypothetical protein B0H11DRAFT_1925022 [Mycena galericulata]|nr:hypothetical protein B0H11DRAFT_1925022 [Mycena galericulata]